MKQQPTWHSKLGVLFAALAILAGVILSGCDSPNDPEMPPYKQVAAYNTPSIANDVAAMGNLAAVAAGAYGTIVLDVRDLGNMHEIFRDTVGVFAGSGRVAIDTINHIVATATSPRDRFNAYQISDYTKSFNPPWGLAFQGPVLSWRMTASRDTFTVWNSDGSGNHGFAAVRYCRASDTSQYSSECNWFFQNFDNANSSGNYVQGFSFRQDGIIAVTAMGSGIHFLDPSGVHLNQLDIPGIAYDCAWSGNNLIIASNSLVVMANVDAVNTAHVVSTLFISSANELRKVAVDWPYALVQDDIDGVYVVDISNPADMKYVQLLGMSRPTAVCVDNGRLYVTNEVTGLVVFQR
jgi:hypothetical protein